MRKNFGAKPLCYPQPVFILAAYNEDGTPNAMNAAWGGISDDQELSFCVSPSHRTVKDLLAVPRNFCQVTELMVQRLELHSHRPRRGLYYERNVHFLLDFLVDLDEVDMTVESGVVYYRRKDDGPVRWQGMA